MSAIAGILSGVAALGALGASLRWNWWRPVREGIPVLMYHKIGRPPAGSRQRSLWISQERFEWQMRTLRLQGYESVTFAGIYAGRLPPKPVIITFDDGYLNQKTEALPLLLRWGMKGVFYIVSDAIGRDNFWHDPRQEIRLPMMSENDIKELLAAGQEIGSHAKTHTALDTMTLEQARAELTESKRRLEALFGVEIISFAFPYGRGEDAPDLVQAAYQAGYRWLLGIHAGIWKPQDPQGPLPRIFVRGDDTKYDFRLQLSRGKSRL